MRKYSLNYAVKLSVKCRQTFDVTDLKHYSRVMLYDR